jgi:hypothetical protein
VKSRAERFREYAADCAKLAAASAKDDQGRAVLALIADAWLRLAESEKPREAAVTTDEGDLLRSSP